MTQDTAQNRLAILSAGATWQVFAAGAVHPCSQ
jgi:hypothetical protein